MSHQFVLVPSLGQLRKIQHVFVFLLHRQPFSREVIRMARTVHIFVIALLLFSASEAQRSKGKSKSKFKALLPAFEPTKPETNNVAEKPSAVSSVSSNNVGKTTLAEPVSPAKKTILPEAASQKKQMEPTVPAEPIILPSNKEIPSPSNKDRHSLKKNVKASPYSLFHSEKPKEKTSKSQIQELQLPEQNQKIGSQEPSLKPSQSSPKRLNANFFAFAPPTTTTPAPTTPKPVAPVQHTLFSFLRGQKPSSQAQKVLPFPVPSMPPYPGLPNNNPQLNNVYRMIATWLVSHAMNGGNKAVPGNSRQSAPSTNRAPPPARPRQNQQRPRNQRRNPLTPPPAKHAVRNSKTNNAGPPKKETKEERALRKMREKAYREYMDEVYDIDVPDNAFANGIPPYNQGPPFGFPW